MQVRRNLVREERRDPVLQAQAAFADQRADGERDKALADRVHAMQPIGREGRPVTLGCHMIMADQQKPVQADAVAVDALEKPPDGSRGQADAFG
jgi:hypothetical protein